MKSQVIVLFGLLLLLISLFASLHAPLTGYGSLVPGKWIDAPEESIPKTELPYLRLPYTEIKRGTTIDLTVSSGTGGLYSIKVYAVVADHLQYIKTLSFGTTPRDTYLITGLHHAPSSRVLKYGTRTIPLTVSKNVFFHGRVYRIVAEGKLGSTTLDFTVH